MSWSNNFTVVDRFYGCLAYLLPLWGVLGRFPINMPPMLKLVYGISPLAIVIALYFFVLKNRKISRSIRFNVLQAMLLGAVHSLCQIVIGAISQPLLIMASLAIGGVCVYSMVITAQGKYAEIKELSKNTHLWVDNI